MAWGKLERNADGSVARWHPLADHMLDVAACFLALASCAAVRRALECTALRKLKEPDLTRLAVLVFLHDFGKANTGFQGRRWLDHARPHGWANPAGHGGEALLALESRDERLLAGLPLAQMDQWGSSVMGLLLASISHHGRPISDSVGMDQAIWRPAVGADGSSQYSPTLTLNEIGATLARAFPTAFEAGGDELPGPHAFAHLFAGLVQLADWLGSDTRFFPFTAADEDRVQTAFTRADKAVAAIGIDAREPRQALAGAPPNFARAFGIPTPHPMQLAAGEPTLGRLVILEAETGSGKTEAALWRFARLFEAGEVDSLYFALPTRAAASQIYERVRQFATQLWPGRPPVVVRALPGYEAADGEKAVRLPDFKVQWNDLPEDREAHRRWAGEASKRFLAATIAVGTIDQSLLAALRVRHAHLRHATLVRSLLVVDEVHASDAYMGAVLEHLLGAHLGAGGSALLLSATLGSHARVRYQALATGIRFQAGPSLAQALAVPYPALTAVAGTDAVAGSPTEKRVRWKTVPAIESPKLIAELALEAASSGARVLIIRNTVPAAIATLQALETAAAERGGCDMLFRVNGVPTLHHSRFSRQDRPLLDAAVEAQIGKRRLARHGLVVIGTQTLEQSLDLDADLLITDICPMDVLLQRLGRLHRHVRKHGERAPGFGDPQAWVLVPADGTLSGFLARPRQGLGRFRDGGGVYPDLRIVEATRRLIEAAPERVIPSENRALVESATHPECLEDLEQELGPAWCALGRSIQGDVGAMRTFGNLQALPYELPFEELRFSDDGERVATRLGAADRLVEFENPPMGPFGLHVRAIPIRAYLLPPGMARDTEAQEINPLATGGFEFVMGNTRFRYDRFGLQRLRPTHERHPL